MIGPIDILNFSMYLDDANAMRVFPPIPHDPGITDYLSRHVSEGDVCVDVGAFVGYYTLLFANLVGASGKVIAFEPDVENFSVLEANVKLNKLHNVNLNQMAVSNDSGKGSLYRCNVHDAGHTTFPHEDCASEPVVIDTIKLDDIPLERVDLLKIDVQGSDLAVLQGAVDLLARNPQITLMVEYEPYLLLAAGYDPSELLSFLTQSGFSIFGKDGVELITTDLPQHKNYYINLICRR